MSIEPGDHGVPNGRRPLDRRLAAILVADVVGYARLTQLDEEETHRRWRPLLATASSLIAERGGRIVKTTGDGFVAEFGSVVEAARVALQWLDKLIAQESEIEMSRRIRVRLGLNLGDVVVADDHDIYGDGVNVAARLEQNAAPNTLLVSDPTWRLLEGKIDRSATDLGERRLKNLAKPLRVWEIGSGSPERLRWMRQVTARRVAIPALVISGLAIGTGIIFTQFATPDPFLSTAAQAAKLSIVVLPFENVGADAANDVYADAITDDLITDLSRIADAFVISPNTSFTLKGRAADLRAAVRQLGVRFALVGNVRRIGENLTVSASLIEGDTGRVIWSQRFSRTRGDMFAFQQEVTSQIARALNLELKQAASDQAALQAPRDLDAQDYAFRAWAEIWNKPQSPVTNRAGLRFAEQALAIDPDNAGALATKCYALTRAAQFNWSDREPHDLLKEAIAAGERAIQLHAKDADALYVLAYATRASGDIQRAGSLLKTAVALNANHAPSHAALGLDRILNGDPAGAHALIERALALSPLDPLRAIWLHHDGLAYLLQGDDAAGLRRLQASIAANPLFPNAHLYAAAALYGLGRRAEAKNAFQRHDVLRPGWTISRLMAAVTITASEAYARQFEPIFERLRHLGMREA